MNQNASGEKREPKDQFSEDDGVFQRVKDRSPQVENRSRYDRWSR